MIKATLAICAAVVLSGCATVLRGGHQNFYVKTEPPGARVKLSTGEECQDTPCTFRKSRKEPFSVTISKDGYDTQTLEVRHHWSTAGTTTGMAGNFLIGGVIGVGVDAMTGANQDLEPNPMLVLLHSSTPKLLYVDPPRDDPPAPAAPAAPSSAPVAVDQIN